MQIPYARENAEEFYGALEREYGATFLASMGEFEFWLAVLKLCHKLQLPLARASWPWEERWDFLEANYLGKLQRDDGYIPDYAVAAHKNIKEKVPGGRKPGVSSRDNWRDPDLRRKEAAMKADIENSPASRGK